MDYKRVMVPLDGSKLAECVFSHLNALAGKGYTGMIDLVRVVSPLELHFKGALPFSIEEEKQINSASIKEASDYLASIKAKIEQSGNHSVIATVLSGNVSHLLSEHLKKSGADLLLIATHGRSGPSRWVLGSVAEKLARTSPVPVVLVRPQECRLDFDS